MTKKAPAFTHLLDRLVPSRIAGLFGSDTRFAAFARPLVNRLVPDTPTSVVIRTGPARGIRLLIDARREKYYWTGLHEAPVQEVLQNVLKPGMTFLDVGAHIGLFTLLASRLVGERGHVHSVEPMEQNRRRLIAGIEINQCSNVTVHGIALDRETGESTLYASESTSRWSLVPDEATRGGILVSCYTLDHFTDMIGAPDVVKVDAEGAEVDVLVGGREFLSEHRPLLIVEFTDQASVEDAKNVLPFYRFTSLNPDASRWSPNWLLESPGGTGTSS